MKDEVLGTGPVYTVGWKYNEGEEEKKERQESGEVMTFFFVVAKNDD